jgi:hypothetical protein
MLMLAGIKHSVGKLLNSGNFKIIILWIVKLVT